MGDWGSWVDHGLILDGRPIEESGLEDGDTIQLGKGAPVLLVSGGSVSVPVEAPRLTQESGEASPRESRRNT